MHYACLLDYLSFKKKRLMDKVKKEVVLRQTTNYNIALVFASQDYTVLPI